MARCRFSGAGRGYLLGGWGGGEDVIMGTCLSGGGLSAPTGFSPPTEVRRHLILKKDVSGMALHGLVFDLTEQSGTK